MRINCLFADFNNICKIVRHKSKSTSTENIEKQVFIFSGVFDVSTSSFSYFNSFSRCYTMNNCMHAACKHFVTAKMISIRKPIDEKEYIYA